MIAIVQQQSKDLKKPPISLRDLLQRFQRETPKFYNVVFDSLYIETMLRIAVDIICKLGEKSSNGSRFYQVSEYYLEQSSKYIVIKHNKRGQILKEDSNSVEANFTREDLDKFEAFEIVMNDKFDKSKNK